MEGNGDEFAIQPGKITHGKDNIIIAILAENEIIDSPDLIALVVDYLLQLQRTCAIASCDIRDLHGRQSDFLCFCMFDPRREGVSRQKDLGQEREGRPVHETFLAIGGAPRRRGTATIYGSKLF